jgi:hypothetical protein
MRVLLKFAAIAIALIGLSTASDAAMESNTDRPGNDYTSVTLPSGSNAAACEALCKADGSNCKAWTFVKPGVQAANPRCWLKNTVPAAQANNCCVSGVMTPPIEANIDRPGGDYTSVTLPGGSNAQACLALCNADGACVAWTFVKAGFQAPNPRCWLKNTVPTAVGNNCCSSGVK